MIYIVEIPNYRIISTTHIECSLKIDALAVQASAGAPHHIGDGSCGIPLADKGPLLPPPFPRGEDVCCVWRRWPVLIC
jgi:hypothetical protein